MDSSYSLKYVVASFTCLQPDVSAPKRNNPYTPNMMAKYLSALIGAGTFL